MTNAVPQAATLSPAETVRRFLSALEARDLVGAQSLLDPQAQMVFPGGATFHDLSELIAWAQPRYRRIAKRIARIDAFAADDGDVVVAQGVLYGQWPDGEPFDEIRFADWFLIRAGRIVQQRVWNDLAEHAPR